MDQTTFRSGGWRMISLWIRIRAGKVKVEYSDEGITQGEASQLNWELEKVRDLLFNKQWEDEVEMESKEVEE